MIKKLTLILFLLVAVKSVIANSCFPVQSDVKMLYDEVGLLSASDAQEINSYLIQVSNQTSNQITVVILNDLCGDEPAMFATELGQEWGVGREGKDNGVVILLKYTGVPGENKVFIAVGYGLEGVIPDATAKLVVENEMLPYFKQDQYSEGLKSALNILVPLAKQEFDYVAYQEKVGKKQKPIPYIFILIVLVIILVKFNNAKTYSQTNGISLWSAFMLGGLMGGGSSRSRGGWDDFSSGGGGFGGFGGGGFGGGGSGGSW